MRNKKVIGLLAVAVFAILTFSGIAGAEVIGESDNFYTYRVEKGNTFWGLAVKYAHGRGYLNIIVRNDNDWERDPKTLQIGEIIDIRKFEKDVRYIINHNSRPFGARGKKGNEKVLKSIDDTPYSAEIKDKLKEAVNASDPVDYLILRGDKFDCMTETNKQKCDSPGGYEIFGKENVYPAKKWEIAAEDYTCYVAVKNDCGNVYPICYETDSKDSRVTPLTPKSDRKPESKAQKDQKKKKNIDEILEAYYGLGMYNKVDHAGTGRYQWAKIRLLPFEIPFEDFNLRLGIFAAGFKGHGSVGDYNYRTKYRYAWGPSLKLLGGTWDTSFDAGLFGRLKKEGGRGLYESKQTERLNLYSLNFAEYSRRSRGETLFPKWELNLEIIDTYDVEHKHYWNGKSLDPKPYSDDVWSLTYTQWVHDYKFDQDLMRFSSGLKLGGGHEYGPDKGFWKFGPAFQLGTYRSNILEVSLGYKEQIDGDGDQTFIGGWISLTGLWDLYKVQKIKEASEEDFVVPARFKREKKTKSLRSDEL